MKLEFKKIKVKEHIFNKQYGYDLDTKEIVDDRYSIYLCENKKHLTQQILLQENLLKKCAISTTHKSIGIDLFKTYVCNFYDTDLNIKDEFSDEVVSYICGDGLYIFDCNTPSKSILSQSLFINVYSKEDTSKINIDEITDDDLEVGYNNNKLIQIETDDKFNRIVKKYKIDLKREKNNKDEKYTEMETIKQNFLEDYENSVINTYKITKEIKSPSIIAGISKNKRYFDIQFNFCLSQSVICEENLQMWFRERRTIDKNIYFCFNEPLQPYRELYKTEYIGKCMNGSINITLKNKKLVNKIDYDTFDIDEPHLLELLKINETIDINSRKSYTQIFMTLLFKHTFTLDTNIKLLRYKKDKPDKKEEEKVIINEDETIEYQIEKRKQIDMENYMNTPILNTIDSHTLLLIKDRYKNQEPVNLYYRQIYKKYNSLNYYMKFKPLIIYFWIKSINHKELYTLDYHKHTLIQNKSKITELDIIQKIDEYLELLDSQIIIDIMNYYGDKYKYEINTIQQIEDLQLNKNNGEFSSKYRKIKNIIKLQTDTNDDEEKEQTNKNKVKTKEQIDKSLIIILNTSTFKLTKYGVR